MTQSTPRPQKRTRTISMGDVFVFPASFSQQRLWFLEQWEPGVYNTPIAVGIKGGLNITALEHAFDEIVHRHEILRTTFKMEDRTLSQVISLHMPISIPITTLWQFSKDIQQVKVRRLIKEDFYRHFDLEHGPLIRISIIQLAEDESVLLLTMHHSISDGWSMEILFHELAVLYTAYASGKLSSLPELSLQYADYALWQREWLQGEVLEKQLAYWQQQLADVAVLQLPTDHPRPAVQTYHGATHKFEVSSVLTTALRTLSRHTGTTLFMTLLAAFQTLLYRYTQQTDIAVGIPIAGRTNSHLEQLIGCFINTLVMRTDLSGDPDILELLKRVRQVALGAYDHQDIPFERLIESLPLERDLSYTPLFQVMFALQNVPQGQIDLEDLTLIPLHNEEDLLQKSIGAKQTHRQQYFVAENKTAMFDLDLTMWEHKEEILAEIKYNTDLFDQETIERMHEHFMRILEGMAADPTQSISTLPLLSDQDWQQQMVEWNATTMNYSRDRCIYEVFEEQVIRSPNAVATIYRQEQLTYRELNELANHLAHQLRQLGAEPETLVAILAERSNLFLTAILAVFKAGAAYLPLDPHHPTTRLLHIIKHSNCAFILVSTTCAATLSQCLESLPPGQRPHVLCLENMLQHITDTTNLTTSATAGNLAYVIYTSGSTGIPKGVMIEHRGMLNHLYAKIEALSITAEDTIAQTASQCFDISVWQFLAALLVGGRVQIYPDEAAHDPTHLFSQVEQHHISILETVPSLLRVTVEAYETSSTTRPALKLLRWLIPTGEALPPDLCRRWLDLYPHIPLLNAYGPTECSDDVTHYPIYQMAGELHSSIPIGYPIGNTQLYILDRTRRPLPIGTVGELYVGGDGIGRGYLGDPRRTAEVFLPDHFRSERTASRLYKTGDLARYKRDGTIEFLGRVDHQVKLHGYRIELGEIETVLRQHEAVRECVVVVHESIHSNQCLVAYITTVQGSSVTSDELQYLVAEQLPKYMVPTTFVEMAALPLTSNSKLDRQALPAPEEGGFSSDVPYVAPRTSDESRLAEIWQSLLGLERVGIHDDFFLLGGHSLLTIRLMTQIEKQFGKRLPVTAVFLHRTVEALARLLQQNAAATLWSPTIDLNLEDIDLQAEASLDLSVCPEVWPGEMKSRPEHILLTGASGFMGKFLLFELLQQTSADIYCLLRSESTKEGRQRLQSLLEAAQLWQSAFRVRIKPVLGDLGKPLLGLSPSLFEELASKLDVIYHNGAQVNMIFPYQELKETNVNGTREILRLATFHKVKPLHYISTLSVLPHTGQTREQVVYEHAQLDDYRPYVYGGYAQSKWVAEKLVTIARSRGLPISIYRPGRITGHSQTGVWDSDLLCQMIKSCIQLGKSPLFLSSDTVDMTPVDYVSKAIVTLSQRKMSLGQVFHLINPVAASVNEIIGWIKTFGYPVEQVHYEDWYEEITRIAEETPERNVLSPFVPTFPEQRAERSDQIPTTIYDTHHTLAALLGTNVTYPPVSEALLHTYLSCMVQQKYLPPPALDDIDEAEITIRRRPLLMQAIIQEGPVEDPEITIHRPRLVPVFSHKDLLEKSALMPCLADLNTSLDEEFPDDDEPTEPRLPRVSLPYASNHEVPIDNTEARFFFFSTASTQILPPLQASVVTKPTQIVQKLEKLKKRFWPFKIHKKRAQY